MRALVTAGNTREKIDRVRDWGNIFTGNTGFAIAKAVGEIAEVDLLTSNRQHVAETVDNSRIHAAAFTSHAELRAELAMLITLHKYDAVFMTAAVADYAPAGAFAVIDRKTETDGSETWRVKSVDAGKVKSTHEQIAFLGKQTEKLVDLFRTEWKHEGLLIKFKLEVGVSKEDLIKIGQASRKSSGADYLVANTLDMVSGESSGAYLLSDAGEEWMPRNEMPARLARLMQK